MISRRRVRRAGLPPSIFLVASLASVLASCRPVPPETIAGSPHESLLTVAGELRRFSAMDFYRHPVPPDLSGFDAFRAALVRLANFEAIAPGSQRDVVEFLRGEALLCLRDYDAAAAAFERAASVGTEMRDAALARRSIARELAAAAAFPPAGGSIADALEALDRRRERLRELTRRWRDRPALTLAEVELEQADVDRARLLCDVRSVSPGGLERAVEAWSDLIAAHDRSSLRMRHRLALAGLFDAVACEYLEANPPAAARFDREAFTLLADRARSLYLEVAQADGYREKLVARARLEALNALVQESLRDLP